MNYRSPYYSAEVRLVELGTGCADTRNIFKDNLQECEEMA